VGKLEELYRKLITREGQKLHGTFSSRTAFEAAGGEWDEKALQWVDYWDDDDRNDPDCLCPWADMTLMLYSEVVGDYRPATEEDLNRIGFVRNEVIR
jgi:hypothetical protein